jgi:hypothetical protein
MGIVQFKKKLGTAEILLFIPKSYVIPRPYVHLRNNNVKKLLMSDEIKNKLEKA